MTPDREHIISAAMFNAENRHGNGAERFAIGEETKATRLGDHAAAGIWKIVAERLQALHAIARPLSGRWATR